MKTPVSAATMTFVRQGSDTPTPAPAPAETVAAPVAATPDAATKTPAQSAATPSATPAPEGGKPGEGEQEAPPEAKKEEAKESQRFALLAKKEQTLVKERQTFATERQAFEAEKLNFQAAQQRLQVEEESWKSDPLAQLEKRGWTYEKLTDLVLNDKKPTTEMVAREEAKKLLNEEREAARKADETRAKAEQEKAQANYDAKIQEVIAECTEFVTTNAEKYELVNVYKEQAIQTILATIEQHYQDTLKAGKPRIMSYEEAAELTEKFYEAETQKALKTKKLSAKAPPQPEGDKKQPATEEKSPPAADPAKPRTTLNNRWVPSSTPKSALTWEERIERARRV